MLGITFQLAQGFVQLAWTAPTGTIPAAILRVRCTGRDQLTWKAEGSKLKADERLAAAQSEHVRRTQDQIRRHEIRVILHLDALLFVAEPAWEGKISFLQKGEARQVSALFVPRSRRWIVRPA